MCLLIHKSLLPYCLNIRLYVYSYFNKSTLAVLLLILRVVMFILLIYFDRIIFNIDFQTSVVTKYYVFVVYMSVLENLIANVILKIF